MEVNQVKGERTVHSEDSTCKGPVVGSYGDCVRLKEGHCG